MQITQSSLGVLHALVGVPLLADAADEVEAFFLRIYGPGDYRWKGADLGVLVTKGRLQVVASRH